MKRLALLLLGSLLILGCADAARAQVAPPITADQLRIDGQIDSSAALGLYRPDLFSTVDGALLIHDLPVLTLLDGRRFPISTDLGRMGLAAIDLPVAFLTGVEVQETGGAPAYGSDAQSVVNFQTSRVQTGGELGVFYGKSGGRFGREDFITYGIGTIATDKFRITAGVSHQESNGRGYSTGRVYIPQH